MKKQAKHKARRTPARRTPARRTPARRTPARRTPARRTPARRTPARRTPARRSGIGRTVKSIYQTLDKKIKLSRKQPIGQDDFERHARRHGVLDRKLENDIFRLPGMSLFRGRYERVKKNEERKAAERDRALFHKYSGGE